VPFGRNLLVLLIVSLTCACTRHESRTEPITLSLIDQSWLEREYRALQLKDLAEFTRQTGVRVDMLPAPESAVDQLALWQRLLDSQAPTPDVYAVDTIWPGVLADHLIDLKPYAKPGELESYFPDLIANYTVNGRLVALPYHASSGLLFYRTDLLRQYGYQSPPATWDEMEQMAARIQAGERAKGIKGFWGFVWQGAPSEALTCNALEWQASEGGGQIIENDGTVSVDNARAIKAWERAARWVGSISPPGVVAYREWDSFNIWQSGQAAFMRNWPGAYVISRAPNSPVKDKFELTALPAGIAGHFGTLGGGGYGVSRSSIHRKEAVMLVQYLCGRQAELHRSHVASEPPPIMDLYNEPEVILANPYFSAFKRAYLKGIVRRPSTVAGKNYPAVSQAYFEAVHSVLTRERKAPEAASELERRLVQITGGRVKQLE
jgi:trehalose/maltose transport system substrate-binding protein